MRSAERVGVAALALWLAGTAGAGAQEQAPPQSAEQMESRFQIAAMEAVLEQAVQLGASNLNMQLGLWASASR